MTDAKEKTKHTPDNWEIVAGLIELRSISPETAAAAVRKAAERIEALETALRAILKHATKVGAQGHEISIDLPAWNADQIKAQARAAFIVRALNSHHDMLEALRKIEGGWVGGDIPEEDSDAFVAELQNIARAAIAKATKEA